MDTGISSITIRDAAMAPSSDEDEDNPEQLLNEWLGELDILTAVSSKHHFIDPDTALLCDNGSKRCYFRAQ